MTASAGGVVLLADDNPRLREFTANVLRSAGYYVLPAADGEEALDIARDWPNIGLLVTDVNMPNLDGIELAAALTRERPGLKVLIVSGSPYKETLSAWYAWDWLAKPFLPSELLTRLNALLEDKIASVKHR